MSVSPCHMFFFSSHDLYTILTYIWVAEISFDGVLLSFYFDVLGKSSYEPATKWTNGMKNCTVGDQPSYLFGDVELQNANLACNSTNFPNNIALGWIGVARQLFLNKDEGELIFFSFT